MATQQDQAVALVNQIIALAASLHATQSQIAEVSSAWTNLSAAAKVNALPTAPLSATGALGTADGAANPADPIDTRVTPAVTQAISANNIAGLLTYLQGVSTAIGGGAVTANGAAAQLIALTH